MLSFLLHLFCSTHSASSFLLFLSWCIILSPFILLFFSTLLFVLHLSLVYLGFSFQLLLVAFFTPAASLPIFLSSSFSLAISVLTPLICFFSRYFRFSLFVFRNPSSAFSLAPSHLSRFKLLPSFTFSSSHAECSVEYCVSVGELLPTHLGRVCRCFAQDGCDAGRKSAAMMDAELSHWESHHSACSRAC